MESVNIRWAQDRDLETLLEFEQALIEAERPMDVTIREHPVHYYDIGEMIRNPEVALVVAEIGDILVGCGYARAKEARSYLDHRQYAYLGFMYTRPEHRGKGINRSVLNALVQWADAQGLYEKRLTVYDTNDAAIRAYEKAGFSKHIIEMRLPR